MTSLSGETASDEKFPQFEVNSDFSDHHFVRRKPKLTALAQKKIMQEWKVLAKELPESIYVRVYETRVDLIRAAIVGLNGTSYRDGLFFFDIALPSKYPSKLPLIHYRTFGCQIHHSFTGPGDICFTMLKDMSKIWDPNQSIIIQLLISFQALVLEDHRERVGVIREHLFYHKLPYNEEVFVENCRTMLRVLSAPPRHFEPLVKQHFNDRAESILKACNAFREGLFDGVAKRAKGHEVSVFFRKKMNRLYGDLLVALESNGASIGHFFEQLMEEKKERKEQAKKEKGGINSMRGVGKSAVKKLKKIVVLDLVKKYKNEKSKDTQFLPEGVHQTV